MFRSKKNSMTIIILMAHKNKFSRKIYQSNSINETLYDTVFCISEAS